MIDLNKNEFNGLLIPTPEEVLKYINDLSIFNYYIKNLAVNTAFKSPLRKDTNPSFSVFFSKKIGRFLFKDLATGESGDCFTFLRKLFPFYNFNQVLQQVCVDFGLQDKFYCGNSTFMEKLNTPLIIQNLQDYKKDHKIIRIKQRDWKQNDILYWKSYGISMNTLEFFEVVPISHIFIYDISDNKETIITADKYAYAYLENKDEITTYKIYQPFSTIMKWLSTHNTSIHQGYTKLPQHGELLIITKSLKDVMSLYEVCNISSVAVQSENVIIKDTVISEYTNRFKKVLNLFDNDKAGIILSQKYKELYNLDYIIILSTEGHEFFKVTDFSDLVNCKGRDYSRNYIKKLINERTTNII